MKWQAATRRLQIGALALSCVLAGCRDATEQDPAPAPIPVRMREVLPAAALGRHLLPGVLEAERQARLAFGAAGNVASVDVEAGDCVHSGQRLAALDQAPFEAHEREARAALESADLAYGRAIALGRIGSQASIDELRLARERVGASLDQARYTLRRSRLSAPFQGCIARRFIELGEAVDEHGPAFLLVAHRPRIRARVGVPASLIDGIEVGQHVEVSRSTLVGHRATGEVVQRGVLADESTGTFAVVVQLDNEAGQLLPGMVVDVLFEQALAGAQEQLVSIPVSALAGVRADRGYVFVEQGGRARKLELRVERLHRDRVVVRSALQAGDAVLVSATRPLREGEAVSLVPRSWEGEGPTQPLGPGVLAQPVRSSRSIGATSTADR